MVAKNYYEEVSATGETYKALHVKVKDACSCIDTKPCSEVSNIMLKIQDGVQKVQVGVDEEWNDDLGSSFTTAMNNSVEAIGNIIDSITSTWSTSEFTYGELLSNLDKLQADNEAYKGMVAKEPHLSDAKYNRYTTEIVDGIPKQVHKQLEGDYRRDHAAWQRGVENAGRALDALTASINRKIGELKGTSFEGGNYYSTVGGVPTGSLSSSYLDVATLVDENNPYETLFETDNTPAGNMAVAWNFLIYKGLTPVQAAGVLGNMWWETDRTFDPAETNSIGAHGLVQWLGGRRSRLKQYAAERGTDENDLQTQLEFLWDEGFSEGSNYRRNMGTLGFFTTSSPTDAAIAFDRKFEISEDWKNGTTEKNRGRPAAAIYEVFGNKENVTAEDAAEAIATLNERRL